MQGVLLVEWLRNNRGPKFLKAFFQYVKVAATVYFYVIILVAYVVGYAEVPSEVQPGLTLSLAIVTFIFRKILLSLTDKFPIEMAMLISGLWVANLNDMVALSSC